MTHHSEGVITALGVSITTDGLDYFAVPLFSTLLIGDIFDFIITSLLYSLTRSKSSTAINMIKVPKDNICGEISVAST